MSLAQHQQQMGLQAWTALDNIARSIGIDQQSIVSHTPAELGVMIVGIIQHRERVQRATRASNGIEALLPEMVASLGPDLRQHLAEVLAGFTDALANCTCDKGGSAGCPVHDA